ncbi:MAG: glycosyltransferase family 4 protein [archaeon]
MKIGLAPHFYNLSLELQKLGVSQNILASETDLDGKIFQGIQVHKFNNLHPFEVIRSGSAAFNKIKELKCSLKEFDFDLIHYHNPGYFLLDKHKKELGVPLIQTIHASPTRIKKTMFSEFSFRNFKEGFYYTLFTRYGLKNCAATIVVANEEKQSLVNQWNADKEKIFVIPTAVDLKDFKIEKKEKKEYDIIYAGRFAPGKRIPDLLKAVEILKETFPDIKLLLVGGHKKDISYRTVLNTIKSLRLEKNVINTGIVSQSELKKLFLKTKVYGLSSVQDGLPKSVLEAMACKLPVVAYGVAGLIDCVEDCKTGYLIQPKNINELMGKLKLLLENEHLRKEFGVKALRKVEKEFNWKRVAQLNKKVYETVLRC